MVLPNDQEIKIFIRKRSGGFLRKMESLRDNYGIRIKWSWFAFLFAPLWLAGQRMIYRVFLYFLFVFIAALTVTLLEIPILFGIVPTLFLMHLYYGLFGISEYRKFVNGKIFDIRNAYSTHQDREKQLKRKGGISIVAVVLTVAFGFLFFKNIKPFMTEYTFWADFSAYTDSE